MTPAHITKVIATVDSLSKASRVARPSPALSERSSGETRVLAMQKSNLAREAPSLKYRVIDVDDVGKTDWLGVSSQTADDLVAVRKTERGPTKTDACLEWLRDLLEDGRKDSREIKVAAEARGFGERVLRDARERLGVETPKIGKVGKEQVTYWRLPAKDGDK